jgi:hypothetical protein
MVSKKLLNKSIITKKNENRISLYCLQNPQAVDKLIRQFQIVSTFANSQDSYTYFEYQKTENMCKSG